MRKENSVTEIKQAKEIQPLKKTERIVVIARNPRANDNRWYADSMLFDQMNFAVEFATSEKFMGYKPEDVRYFKIDLE
jgi:uncharacterized protein YdhG (YjbR/CyaY superfamily)